ncbi:kinase-like domain-containing protein [Schizophyllum commune]
MALWGVPLTELTQDPPIRNYLRLEKLGQGVYATIWKGRSRITNKIVALKDTILDEEYGFPETAMREASLLKDLEHPNVIRFYEAIATESMLTLVFDFCDSDLKQYMRQHGALPLDVARSFMKQLLEGTAYCRKSNIIHRDIKPENVFLSSDGVLKLGDFGLSCTIGLPIKKYRNEVVTLWYRAPELLLGSTSYGPAIDVWSCGCILAEMIQGTPLCRGADIQGQLNAISRATEALSRKELENMKKEAPELDISASRFPRIFQWTLRRSVNKATPDAIELLEHLLEYNPAKRITATDALKYSYFISAQGPDLGEYDMDTS